MLRRIGGYETSCICGFKVSNRLTFPITEIIGGHLISYIANTNNPNGFQFNITRQSLLESRERERFSNFIAHKLIEVYRNFLIEKDSYKTETISRLFVESISSLTQGGVFDSSDKLKQLVNLAGDLLCYKLHKINLENTYSDCPIEFHNINELMSKNYTLISVHEIFSRHNTGPAIRVSEVGLYEAAKACLVLNSNTYFVKRGESDLLFTNDPSSYVCFYKLGAFNGGVTYVTCKVSHSSTIDPECDKDWILGIMQTTSWTGSVCERQVIGGKFAFGEQILYVTPNSLLAKDLKRLYNEGNHDEACYIIKLLEISLFGDVNDLISKYISES